MEAVILQAVNMMNDYVRDIIKVEIIDTELHREYPDAYNSLGYLGCSILISCYNKRLCEVFLTYQQAEDMCIYSKIVEDFLLSIIKIDDVKHAFLSYQRKEKINKINSNL